MSTIDIPACPGVVTDAMQEAQKDEPDLVRLATLIGSDAGMSAAALRDVFQGDHDFSRR